VARLTAESLDFARAHLEAYWDSDFFPKSFEFHALWRQWNLVRDQLSQTDIADLEVVLPRIMAAPKPDCTYRVVHQLDPLNAVAYTAMSFMIAEAVERARPVEAQRVACSYRILIDRHAGRLFREGNGYSEFVEQSRALAAANPSVLTTDITDFYNQIYLHRLQNAISSADNTLDELATDIEVFLTRLNDTVSHGVPVGPSASIVMSEAVLIDVDSFITGQGFAHTRYVDDFRIFGPSETELSKLQQALTLYLHKNHRLVLASGKTKILSSPRFLETVLDSPHEIERRVIHAELGLIDDLNGYDFEDDQSDGLPVNVQQRADVLRRLMQSVIEIEPLDLALARRVFRQSRRYRIRAIMPQLFNYFDRFAPVMNDVVLYLAKVLTPSVVDRYENQIEQVLTTTQTLDSKWIRHWVAHLILNSPALLMRPRFERWLRQYGNMEHQANCALLRRDVAWVREHRGQVDEIGRWQRRQIMRAGLALALDERRHWYRHLRGNNPSVMDQWLLEWLLAR
jgi:hypothetical protein